VDLLVGYMYVYDLSAVERPEMEDSFERLYVK